MNIWLVPAMGAIIVIVAAVSYLKGRSAGKREGTHSQHTDDTEIRVRALSPASRQKLLTRYQQLLDLDDRSDSKFKRVNCD